METDKASMRTMRRTCILLQLQASYPISLSLSTIRQGVIVSGQKISESELCAELEYLCEIAFVEKQASKISAGFFRYKLSPKGIEFLESEGF